LQELLLCLKGKEPNTLMNNEPIYEQDLEELEEENLEYSKQKNMLPQNLNMKENAKDHDEKKPKIVKKYLFLKKKI
jgi:hypothetical protein